MLGVEMKIFIILVALLLLVGCGNENDNEDIECKDGFVYNSRFEICVKDLCEETISENLTCEMGCLIYEKENEIQILCVKQEDK
jgi:major membrane immunogen (membrane-anchored lipoprotein)